MRRAEGCVAAADRSCPPAVRHERPLPPPLPGAPRGRGDRLAALGFALLGCLVFAIAAILSPYDEDGRPKTHGTHRQLGLPPCALKLLTGLPCPSCGMTTSISLVMHGDLRAAWRANWAGVVVTALGVGASILLLLIAAGISELPAVNDLIRWITFAGVGAAMLRWAVTTVTHAAS